MNISRTHHRTPGAFANHRENRSQTDVAVEQDQQPQELYDFKTNASMVGAFSLLGAVGGSIPGLGALSYGAPANERGAGKLTKAAAIGGFVANIVSTAVVATGGPAWAMAVPGVLGAVTWGSFAFDTRNHC